jgi:diguanylate cyclase (GGDEF)-like protein
MSTPVGWPGGSERPITREVASCRFRHMALLPLSASLTRARGTVVYSALALLWLTIAVAAAQRLSGFGGDGLDRLMRDWASSLVYVLAALVVALRAFQVREARGPWIVISIGVSLYGLGNLLWALWLQGVPNPPIPSVADGLWLSLYPASYLGLVWLARTGHRRVPAGVWLDGIVAGLGIGAAGAAIVFRPVLEAATGGTLAVATNLAYPIGDLLLAALVMGVFALRGWRPDRNWGLLGAGFLVLCVADSIYLLNVASGSFDSSTLANLFYMSGVGLLALAAWQPQTRVSVPNLQGWSMLLVPGAFIVTAIVLLAEDHAHPLDPLARTLALLTLAAGFLRAGLSFRDLRTLAVTQREALTDDLTLLANRRQLLRQLEQAVRAASDDRGSVALLVIDLDHFKELNDTLGHHAGDDLLRQIGPRLKGVLRESDTLARLGGDEFGLVLGARSNRESALRVADKVRTALADPFDVADVRLHVSASVGIALFPEHGQTGQELLRMADVAMYEAKGAHTGRELYRADRDTHTLERLTLVADLERALATDEITVHFQPKANAATRAVVGVEALVRWFHPVRGFIGPDAFVTLAEHSGLGRALTTRVLDISLDQCRDWRWAGHDLDVSVNVTVADLLDADFPDDVTAALAARGVPPSALMIEITERSILSDPVRVSSVLAALRDRGVGVSLDDFGTGYSSFTHLRTLPVNEVKIDRSFVAQMTSDHAAAAIVASTIQLSHALGLEVVAEGVEDEETWRRLAEAGCQLIQGYALARPAPAADLAALLPHSGGIGQVPQAA